MPRASTVARISRREGISIEDAARVLEEMKSEEYVWSSNTALNHHCPICAAGLNSHKALSVCIRRGHVEPCPGYHPTLHRFGTADRCSTCNKEWAAHEKVHREILALLRQAEREAVQRPKRSRSRKKKKKRRPRSRSRHGGAVASRTSNRERSATPDGQRRRPKLDLDVIDTVLHQVQDQTAGKAVAMLLDYLAGEPVPGALLAVREMIEKDLEADKVRVAAWRMRRAGYFRFARVKGDGEEEEGAYHGEDAGYEQPGMVIDGHDGDNKNGDEGRAVDDEGAYHDDDAGDGVPSIANEGYTDSDKNGDEDVAAGAEEECDDETAPVDGPGIAKDDAEGSSVGGDGSAGLRAGSDISTDPSPVDACAQDAASVVDEEGSHEAGEEEETPPGAVCTKTAKNKAKKARQAERKKAEKAKEREKREEEEKLLEEGVRERKAAEKQEKQLAEEWKKAEAKKRKDLEAWKYDRWVEKAEGMRGGGLAALDERLWWVKHLGIPTLVRKAATAWESPKPAGRWLAYCLWALIGRSDWKAWPKAWYPRDVARLSDAQLVLMSGSIDAYLCWKADKSLEFFEAPLQPCERWTKEPIDPLDKILVPVWPHVVRFQRPWYRSSTLDTSCLFSRYIELLNIGDRIGSHYMPLKDDAERIRQMEICFKHLGDHYAPYERRGKDAGKELMDYYISLVRGGPKLTRNPFEPEAEDVENAHKEDGTEALKQQSVGITTGKTLAVVRAQKELPT